MSKCTAYTFVNGVIHFGDEVPRGALPIAIGDEASLRETIDTISRHGYTPGVLLVPGMPEADDQGQALEALEAFCHRVQQSLAPRACRVCGCTNDRACPGGCYWVERDLCSVCASKN